MNKEHQEYQYLNLLKHILENGIDSDDRTGVGTKSIFGYQMRFDLQEGFPLLTTKKLHLKSIIHELIWILSGNTNIKYLQNNKVTIWDEWADENGDLGPVYGHQWRNFGATKLLDGTYANDGIDQIRKVIDEIKTNPNSRRLIVSAWSPKEIDEMKLPPCHSFFQFYVRDGKLSCQLYQRSADTFLGSPYNIASYSLLIMMIAQVTDLKPGEFVYTLGDAHLYNNHIEQAKLQIQREPRKFPIMKLNPNIKDIFEFKYEDFTLEGYDPHPHIKAEVAV